MAALLLLSVALLTAYFRESGGGAAHRLQDGVLTVVSPLQSGTATLTRPFRDAWNWVGRLFSAQAEVGALRREVEQLRAGLAEELTTQAENEQLRTLLAFHEAHVFPRGAKFLTARVVARSATAWYSTATVNVGSADGVRVDSLDALRTVLQKAQAEQRPVTLLLARFGGDESSEDLLIYLRRAVEVQEVVGVGP